MEKNSKLAKSVMIFCITIVAGFFMWYFWKNVIFLNVANFTGGSIWKIILSMSPSVIMFCLLFAMFGILAAIIRSKLFMAISAVVTGSFIFIFFGFDMFSFVAFLLFVLASILYMVGVARESALRIQFLISKIVVRGLAMLIFVFILTSSLLFFSQIKNSQSEFLVPDNVLNAGYMLAEGILKTRIENYNSDMSVDEFLLLSLVEENKLIKGQSSVTNELTKYKNSEGRLDVEGFLSSLPYETRELFDSSKKEFYRGLGIDNDLNSDLTMKGLIKEVMNQMISGFVGENKFLTSVLLSVLFFVGLEIFNPLFYFITLLIALLVYEILRATKFINMSTEKVDVDRIEL